MKIKIRHKLFFTLFASSTIVAASIFFFLQWNFDRGFLKYVKQQEVEQLNILVEELAYRYQVNGGANWRFLIRNHAVWQQLHAQLFTLEPKRTELRPPPRREGGMHPPLQNLRNIGPRVILYDENKNRIIGGPHDYEEKRELVKYPIQVKGETVGFLSLISPSTLSHEGDLLFVEEQTKTFMMVAVIMFLMSVFLTFPLTVHLLKPIKRLTRGTIELVKGKFSTRIPVLSSDELGTLSEHFNILATTLEKNEQARRQWVADISHELRTPLAILRGDVEAIQDGVRKPTEESMSMIHGEVMHLERLVGDLYELSMSDVGALTYKKKSVAPVEILATVIEQFEQPFVAKGIVTHVDLEEGASLTLLGDQNRLQQLFMNILENSLKYTDSPGSLYIRSRKEAGFVFFEFDDTAPGVDEQRALLLFDRLYRGDLSRNRAQYGAGLGLTICKNIVEAHQGIIKADLSEKGGVHLVIKLPFLDRG